MTRLRLKALNKLIAVFALFLAFFVLFADLAFAVESPITIVVATDVENAEKLVQFLADQGYNAVVEQGQIKVYISEGQKAVIPFPRTGSSTVTNDFIKPLIIGIMFVISLIAVIAVIRMLILKKSQSSSTEEDCEQEQYINLTQRLYTQTPQYGGMYYSMYGYTGQSFCAGTAGNYSNINGNADQFNLIRRQWPVQY